MGQKARYPIYNSFPVEGVEYLPGVNLYRFWHGRGANAKPVLIYQPLGNVWVAIEWAAQRLGILTLAKVISLAKGKQSLKPPVITDEIKQLGARYSPEFICFPYKVILGYLFYVGRMFEKLRGQMLYPVFLSHEGPLCRERAYGRLQEVKLSELYQQEFQKQDFDFYIVKESLVGLLELIALFQKFSGKNFLEVVKIINASVERLDIVERFEDEVRRNQSLGADFWPAEKILEEMKEAIAQDKIPPRRILRDAQEKLRELHKSVSKPKVVYITGEIFHTEEAERCSGDVLREIAKRGFYPQKRIGLGHYTPRFQLTFSRFLKFLLTYCGIPARHRMKGLARKGGLGHDAGGHSDDTVGLRVETLEAKARGEETCHGVVELMPFNCLPQIVAANVAMKLKGGVPWLRLGYDEQTGRVGVLTRLEAFLDLLEINENKKRKKL